MKELSIEQKAKRYDEAIERAKEQLEGAKVFDYKDEQIAHDIRTTVYEIFPELKESDDEKIRKEILQSIKDNMVVVHKKECLAWLEKQTSNVDNANKEYWRGYREGKQEILDKYAELEKQGNKKSIWHNEDEEPKRDSLILLIMQSGIPIVAKIIEPNHTFNHGERWAYIDDLLEKQGEHQKFRDSIQVGDKVTRNEDGVLVNLSQLNRVAKREEPTYTQKDVDDAYLKGLEDAKSTESNEDPCKNCDQRAMNCQNFPCDRKKAFDEKMFAWSEEDGRMVETIISHLERLKNYHTYTTNIEQCQDWLKSLKGRIQPQPKQEWSEEDETNMLAVLVACGHEYGLKRQGILGDWLKSLKPQNQWKPSDEQMEALDNFIYAKYPNTEKYGEVIKLLYDDLKKLKD